MSGLENKFQVKTLLKIIQFPVFLFSSYVVDEFSISGVVYWVKKPQTSGSQYWITSSLNIFERFSVKLFTVHLVLANI